MAPNAGKIGRPAQPKGGFHELTSVPIHLFHVVRGHRQFMAPPQTPRLEYVSAAARAHALAKAMHAFAPADLRLPSALGRHCTSLFPISIRVTTEQYSRATCSGQPRLGSTARQTHQVILITVARKSRLGSHKRPNPKYLTVGKGEPPARPYAQRDCFAAIALDSTAGQTHQVILITVARKSRLGSNKRPNPNYFLSVRASR